MQIIFQGIRVYGVQCDASNDERTNNWPTRRQADEWSCNSSPTSLISSWPSATESKERSFWTCTKGRYGPETSEWVYTLHAMFGALKDGEPSESSSADKGDKPDSRTFPYKPAIKKKPSPTKAASLTKLKEKSVSVFKAAKSISKRKLSSAVDRKRIKLLAISYQKVNF